METTARNRTIGGIVIGAIILILLLVLFSCTVNSDPESSPKKDPTTGESSQPSDQDTLEPDDKPSESESEDAEGDADEDDIVPAANTGVTFIPAGNVPSGSTPTCELDKSACEPTRPPGAGVDICEIRPDLDQCQPPPTTPPTETDPPTNPEEPEPEDPELPVCGIWPLPDCPENPSNQAPTAPVVDQCEVETSNRATISWTKSEDPDGKVVGYNVYRDPDARMSDDGKRSATFSGLESGETYTFWVRAVDSDGKQSDESNRVECVMDKDAPEIPTIEEATPVEDVSDSTLFIDWTDSDDKPTEGNVGTAGYVLYDGNDEIYRGTDTEFTHEGLKAGSTHSYRVRAFDEQDNISDYSEPVEGTTTKVAPTVPQNVKVTNSNLGGFDVEWNASKDQDGVTPDDEIKYIVEVHGGLLGGILCTTRTTGKTSTNVICLLSEDANVTVTAEDSDGNQSAPSEPAPVSANSPRVEGNTSLRKNAPNKDKSDAPADKPELPKVPSEVPSDEPTEEKSPLLPPLGDVLGGDKAEEEPVKPEPTESESPAERPTTEEPAEEKDAPAEEDKDEDKDGILGGLVGSLSAAVSAVF